MSKPQLEGTTTSQRHAMQLPWRYFALLLYGSQAWERFAESERNTLDVWVAGNCTKWSKGGCCKSQKAKRIMTRQVMHRETSKGLTVPGVHMSHSNACVVRRDCLRTQLWPECLAPVPIVLVTPSSGSSSEWPPKHREPTIVGGSGQIININQLLLPMLYLYRLPCSAFGEDLLDGDSNEAAADRKHGSHFGLAAFDASSLHRLYPHRSCLPFWNYGRSTIATSPHPL